MDDAIIASIQQDLIDGDSEAAETAARTALEARLMGEVGHAASRQGVTRAQANQWILQLMGKYEHVFQMPEGNPGVRFDRAYDLDTLRPLPEWTHIYEEFKAELKEIDWIYPGNSHDIYLYTSQTHSPKQKSSNWALNEDCKGLHAYTPTCIGPSAFTK